MTPDQIAKAGTETAHQMALFCWCALHLNEHPELNLLFAIKNEEKSGSAIVGMRFKAAGVKKDMPDTFLPVARGGYYGLFIEMKKPGEKARPGQLAKGKELQQQGYGFVVCDHWEKAAKVLVDYLNS